METLNFKKYGMKIHLNKITAIIGPESCGKTTVFKLLSNKIKNDSLYLDRKRLNDYKMDFLRKNVMVIFNFDEFNTDYVKEELAYYLKKFKETDSVISSKVSKIVHFFKIEDIIDYKIDVLNVEEKCLIKILSFLIVNPMILGIDNLVCYLNKEKCDLVFKYIKEQNISLIYTSTDPERLIYADEIIIIDKFKFIKSGTYDTIFREKVIDEHRLAKPFLKELNEYLKYYDLIKEDYETINECVGALWK